MNNVKKDTNRDKAHIDSVDQKCIHKIRRGDLQGLEDLYKRYRDEFVGWAKKNSLQEADALDLYQTSIIIVQENIMKGKLIRLKERSIRPFLYRIARNKILERSRKNGKLPHFLILI